MLNGIEVLNKVELMDNVFNPMCIIPFILFVMTIVVAVKSGVDEYIFVFVVSIILLSLFFILSMTIYYKQIPNGQYEYQVTISDSVSMVEFNEKYDVIEVEGKIYTIREKEEKGNE